MKLFALLATSSTARTTSTPTTPDNTGLDEKIWHGETDIADWNAFGGVRPGSDQPRNYESMFDNDLSTYWVGYLPVTQQNKVVVTFKKPVEFHELQIVTRPADKQYFDGSYQSMCLVLDDDINEKICTPANNDVDIGQVLVLASANTLTATKVELIIQNGEVGQIADFKIHYQVNLDMGTCNNGAWSSWKDRDDPSGSFDAETIEDFATDYSDGFQGSDLCTNPIAAQSRILGTTDMSTTEDVEFSSNGLRCKNTEQTDGKCSDYEVRFCCPKKVTTHKLSDGRTISYVRSSTMMSYTEANSWCTQQSGRLPVPRSQEENDFLANIGSTWLAVNTMDLNGLTYTNWGCHSTHCEPSGDATQVELIVGKMWGKDWGFGTWNDGGSSFAATCYLEMQFEVTEIFSLMNHAIPSVASKFSNYGCAGHGNMDASVKTVGRPIDAADKTLNIRKHCINCAIKQFGPYTTYTYDTENSVCDNSVGTGARAFCECDVQFVTSVSGLSTDNENIHQSQCVPFAHGGTGSCCPSLSGGFTWFNTQESVCCSGDVVSIGSC